MRLKQIIGYGLQYLKRTRLFKAATVLRDPSRHVDFIPTSYEDGLITSHVCSYATDPRFQAAYAEGTRTNSWKTGHHAHWRVYIACALADHAKLLPGDFVECGVHYGAVSAVVMHYIDFNASGKSYYLLDTFEGIPVEFMTEEEMRINDPNIRPYKEEKDQLERVKKTFSKYHNAHIVPGPIPDTLTKVAASKVCFLHLDMNNAFPEIKAAEFFWDKVVSGGVILLDDYAYADIYAVQKREMDKFATGRGVHVVTLPTGQGLILKP